MARTTKKVATKRKLSRYSPQAAALKRNFLKERAKRKEAMALVLVEAPKKKRKKRKTTKKKSTSTSSSVISPVCSRAGRRLKVAKSPKAGATLGSKRCKTKKTTTRKTTAKRTTAKKTTSAVKRRSTRRSTAASKLSRIKKIVC